MNANKKTLVVGLDAACWEYVNPLLRSDKMPTLKKYIDTGYWGTLNSTMPPWTPTAWSSIITGKNPGKHGIFDLLWKRPGKYEFIPTNETHRRGMPFWITLNKNGIKTGVVNAPFTYPPKPLDGFLVCGFGTPNSASDIAYPVEVQDWISNNIKDFSPEVDANLLTTASPQIVFSAEKQQQANFVEIAGKLAVQYQVDVLVINLMFPDHANHKMPKMAQIEAAYEQTDKDLATIVEMFSPDNVMILSDHGSSRLKGDFMLGAWLRDNGYYVTLKNESQEIASNFNWLIAHYFQDRLGRTGIVEKIARRFITKSLFHMPKSIQDKFWQKFESIFPDARQYLNWSSRPNYSSTQVFTGSVYSGLLYLNLVGREKDGVVPDDKKMSVLKELASRLMEVKDPNTAKPLFDNIYFAEDIYSGPNVANGPDLILDSYSSGWNLRVRKDYFPAPPSAVTNRYFVLDASHRDFGWHSKDGIFVFSGEAFNVGPASTEFNLIDIPATLLHLYDVPVPEDYDGLVRKEAMVSEYQSRHVEYQPSGMNDSEETQFSPEEEAALLEHLRALGYLD